MPNKQELLWPGPIRKWNTKERLLLDQCSLYSGLLNLDCQGSKIFQKWKYLYKNLMALMENENLWGIVKGTDV
jgi:hypothetical protein